MCSQEPDICIYPEQGKTIQYIILCSFGIHFNIILS
jgi:hypothetical protein